MGVGVAHHHPNASTFCGRCAEVCPVKIPLPKIMRYWRAREYASGLAPKAMTFGLSVWAFFARHPALYRLLAGAGARVLKFIASQGSVRGLPLMRNWFLVRDFPSPQGRTFRELWAARK
jgi:L-lactate dehydrogenase complex protein LldF